MRKIGLGDRVRDTVSGLEGLVTGRAEYLWGCIHLLINPGVIHEGKPVEGTWLDEGRCALLKAVEVAPPPSASERAGAPAGTSAPAPPSGSR